MRILAALVLAYHMVMGHVGTEMGAGNNDVPVLPTGVTAAALSELDRAVGIALAGEFETASPLRRVTRGGRVLFIPEGCSAVDRAYDLVIHFHGAPGSVEPAFEKSGLGGVLTIFNLGNGSGKYEEAYQAPGAFDEQLARISEIVREMCPGASGVPSRIALSAWSAGYGAIWRILDRPNSADRVDAVLLADGLHAGFEPDGERDRVVSAAKMAAFTLYADRAVAGEKLMAITHSSISTPYASTTETARFLLDQEDITEVRLDALGPRPGMQLLYRADRGNFHVQGYAGDDKPAHCDHLHAIGDTLLPLLRERWSR